MSQLDDLGVDNPDEDRIQGAEDYLTEGWAADGGIIDPDKFDNPEARAETIPHEEDVHEIAKGVEAIVEDEEAGF